MTLGQAASIVQDQVQERDSTESSWLPSIQATREQVLQSQGRKGGWVGSVRVHCRTLEPALSEARGTCIFALAKKSMAVGLWTSVPPESEGKPNKGAPTESELTEEPGRV